MGTSGAADRQTTASPVQEASAQSKAARPPGGRPWLGRALFILSIAGLPLSRLVLTRLGRKGGLLLEAVCTLLFARAVHFVVTGTAARLRTLPRFLAYAELVTDSVAAVTGLWVWVWQPFAASRRTIRPRHRTAPEWGARLNALSVAAMFILHTIRMAIYLTPDKGLRDEGSARKRPADGRASPLQEVAEGVSRLPLYGSNVYLVRSGSSWVLVDTGWAWGSCGRKIRQAAEALFGPNACPAAILLTHIHPDHDGAALALARTWDCPVYVHPDELPMTTADLAELERLGNQLDRRAILPLLRALPRRRVESMLASTSLRDVARAFDPGAAVPCLPDWTCVPTPGHSPGHIALFREGDRVLIAGDAVLTVDVSSLRGWLAMGLRHGRPHVFGPPRYMNWDQRATDASVAVLAALEPRVLATSHGVPVAGEVAARELRMLAEQVAVGRGADISTAGLRQVR